MEQSLADIIEGLPLGVGRTVKLCNFLSLWEKVVDEGVRKNAQAINIRGGVLYISTSTPAWAQELTFLKSDIIKKFNAEAGESVITDIRFRPGG